MRFSFAFLLFFAAYSHAQSVKSDTAFLADAKKNAVALYEDQMQGQSHLINGGFYNKVERLNHDPSKIDESHPYFAFEWVKGTVLYDGEWYNSTFLYDLNQDNLIMQNVSMQIRLVLVKEKVGQFILGNYRFANLDGTPSFNGGFYEVAYDGFTKVYVRREKTRERVVGYDVEVPFKYVPKTTYYIKRGDQFYLVKSKRSVLKVLAGRESELKEFVRSESRSFKDNRAFFISEMARLYDLHQPEK